MWYIQWFVIAFLHLGCHTCCVCMCAAACMYACACVTLRGHWSICCFQQQDGSGPQWGGLGPGPRDLAVGISQSDYYTGLALCASSSLCLSFLFLCNSLRQDNPMHVCVCNLHIRSRGLWELRLGECLQKGIGFEYRVKKKKIVKICFAYLHQVRGL